MHVFLVLAAVAFCFLAFLAFVGVVALLLIALTVFRMASEWQSDDDDEGEEPRDWTVARKTSEWLYVTDPQDATNRDAIFTGRDYPRDDPDQLWLQTGVWYDTAPLED